MKDFKELASTVYHYDDEADTQIIEFVMAPAIALNWTSENPVWSQIIGAPGSGKTAHIMLYAGWPKMKMVSRITKNSLISGYRDEDNPDEDPSFLNELDGMLLIVKDFTTILQSPREERDSVIGQLRDIFDGDASRVFGNIGLQEYHVKFNMLLAVTNEIDRHAVVNQALGERFISRREFGKGREMITTAAFASVINGTDNTGARDNLASRFQYMLDKLPPVPLNAVTWSTDMQKRAVLGADFIARCRSSVVREKAGSALAGRPAPEVGGRLVTQIAQCVTAQTIAAGYDKVTNKAWKYGGAKILRDTVPSAIMWILYYVYSIRRESRQKGGPWFSIKNLSETNLGSSTLTYVVTNMHFNGLLEAKNIGRAGRHTARFRINDFAYDVIKNTRLFSGYSNDEADIAEVRERVRTKEEKRAKGHSTD